MLLYVSMAFMNGYSLVLLSKSSFCVCRTSSAVPCPIAAQIIWLAIQAPLPPTYYDLLTAYRWLTVHNVQLISSACHPGRRVWHCLDRCGTHLLITAIAMMDVVHTNVTLSVTPIVTLVTWCHEK